MEQAQYQSLGGEFAEMKSWVLSKLLWNPNLDTRMLVEQFINDYYGEAAQYIQQYFDLCHSLIKDDTVMGIYINEKNPLYTDEFVAEGKNILELAKQAVAKADDATRHRVDLVALQMDYLRLMRDPEETKSDGTYDRFCDFIRKYNIKANEPMPVEVFIDEYNKRVNR
jgi:alpha-glucuronidase